MTTAFAPSFHASRLGLGAAALLALYVALLGGFVRATSQPPPSTVVQAVAP